MFTVVGDVRSLESATNAVQKVVERFGSLSILVNNAAGNFLCLLEDLSLGAFKVLIKFFCSIALTLHKQSVMVSYLAFSRSLWSNN